MPRYAKFSMPYADAQHLLSLASVGADRLGLFNRAQTKRALESVALGLAGKTRRGLATMGEMPKGEKLKTAWPWGPPRRDQPPTD